MMRSSALLATVVSLAAFLLIPLATAVPNYQPPASQLDLLPPDWRRGHPPWFNSSLLSRAHHLEARRKGKGPHSSALQACLLSHRLEVVSSTLNTSQVFWDASQADNIRFHYHADAIVYPRTSQEVSQAVLCASSHGNVAVVARSGGHSFGGFGSGGQDGSLIVDMKHFEYVHSHSDKGYVDVGAASRLGDVAKGLWADGHRAMPHGTCPTVGTGGHATCGGFGPTSRKWGMATDAVMQAEVVLADGSIVRAEPWGQHKELLWGLKGAGHNFGIVTEFRFKTYEAPGPHVFVEYRWCPSLKSGEEMARIVTAIQDYSQDNLPAEFGFHVQVQQAHPDDPPGGAASLHVRGMYMGSLETFRRSVSSKLWDHLRRKGAPMPDKPTEKEMNYIELMEEWDDFGMPGHKLDTVEERKARNNFLARTELTMGQKGFTHDTLVGVMQALLDRANAEVQSGQELDYSWNVYMELYGGTNARHRDRDIVEATSFPHRDGLWLIQSSVGTWGYKKLRKEGMDWLHEMDKLYIDAIKRDGLERRSFPCYADPTLPEAEWKHLYFGNSMPRLEALKKKVDPYNLFRTPQSIFGPYSKAPATDDVETTSSKGKGKHKSPKNVHPLPRAFADEDGQEPEWSARYLRKVAEGKSAHPLPRRHITAEDEAEEGWWVR